MTTTSIRDVNAVMNVVAANAGKPAGNVAESGFQNVWNHQTGKNAASEEIKTKVSDNKNTDPRDEVLKAGETVRKPVREASGNKAAKAEPDDKQLEEALEVLGTIAGEMIQQVADTLGISPEEVQQLMDELDMSTLDILNPEQLGNLLLQAFGAEDSMALLMNEELYSDFKQLMKEQQELLGMAGNELEMSREQLAQLVDEFKPAKEEEVIPVRVQEELPVEAEEPVIEIITETDEETEKALDGTEEMEKELSGNLTADSTKQTKVQNVQTQSQTEDDGKKGAADSNTHSGNILQQELKNEILQTEAAEVQKTSSWTEDTQEIMRQIMDYLKIQIKPGMSELEMQLHPESLGTLQIHVTSKGGALTANFVTQNETVKAALEGQMVQLKESFAQQGMKVENIEVTVQTHQFERNLDQGRGSSSQEDAAKKGRPRRINLNAPEGLGEQEDITREEKMAAELMTANGNTVDYTA